MLRTLSISIPQDPRIQRVRRKVAANRFPGIGKTRMKRRNPIRALAAHAIRGDDVTRRPQTLETPGFFGQKGKTRERHVAGWCPSSSIHFTGFCVRTDINREGSLRPRRRSAQRQEFFSDRRLKGDFFGRARARLHADHYNRGSALFSRAY